MTDDKLIEEAVNDFKIIKKILYKWNDRIDELNDFVEKSSLQLNTSRELVEENKLTEKEFAQTFAKTSIALTCMHVIASCLDILLSCQKKVIEAQEKEKNKELLSTLEDECQKHYY